MKKSLFIFTALTFSFTTNLTVQAQSVSDNSSQTAQGVDDPRRQEFRQKMLQRFDANHDGVLDDSERAQMHQMMQQRRLQEQNEGVKPGAGIGASGTGQAGEGCGQYGGGYNEQQRE